MKRLIIFLFALMPYLTLAQEFKSEKAIDKKLKNTLKEANLLYQYRLTEWIGIELSEKNESIEGENLDFIIYKKRKNFHFVLLDTKENKKVGTYTIHYDNKEWNADFDNSSTKLSKKEAKLFALKSNIEEEIIQLTETLIEERENYSVSGVLIPGFRNHKYYVFLNTALANIIPIGNDGIFYTTKKGKIKGYEWFHMGIVELHTQDTKVVDTHKHNLQSFISPIALANFKLYGQIYQVERMPILLPNVPTYIEYNSDKNTLQRLKTKF